MDSCSSFGHVTSYSPPFDLDRTVQKRALRLRFPKPSSRVVDMPAHRPPLPPGAPTPPSLLTCPPPGHPPLPHKTEPRFRSSHSCSCRSTRRRGRNPKRGRGPHLPPDEALPWIICAIWGLPLPTWTSCSHKSWMLLHSCMSPCRQGESPPPCELSPDHFRIAACSHQVQRRFIFAANRICLQIGSAAVTAATWRICTVYSRQSPL